MPQQTPPNPPPNPKKKIVMAFDAYGTLLSTESIAKKLADHFGDEKADVLAQSWRKYQLEYTWRLNSMGNHNLSTSKKPSTSKSDKSIPGQYKDFSYITLQSLKNALAEHALSLSSSDLQALLSAYDSLTIFPDVAKTCEKLRTTPDIHPVVFSNGTNTMVTNSITKSPSLKDHADVFKDIITVEEVRKFKPAAEVYRHLAEKVGVDPQDEKALENVWLVSGNPFDIVGARAFGMNAIWVNRKGGKRGWEDGLVEGEKGRPTEVVSQLHEAVVTVMSHAVDLAGQWSEFHGASEEHGSRETA
jgi:2-haloacid dehalogenase